MVLLGKHKNHSRNSSAGTQPGGGVLSVRHLQASTCEPLCQTMHTLSYDILPKSHIDPWFAYSTTHPTQQQVTCAGTASAKTKDLICSNKAFANCMFAKE
jgi:hypothetical protein